MPAGRAAGVRSVRCSVRVGYDPATKKSFFAQLADPGVLSAKQPSAAAKAGDAAAATAASDYADGSPIEHDGEAIGTIVKRLGEGAMGTVYLLKQAAAPSGAAGAAVTPTPASAFVHHDVHHVSATHIQKHARARAVRRRPAGPSSSKPRDRAAGSHDGHHKAASARGAIALSRPALPPAGRGGALCAAKSVRANASQAERRVLETGLAKEVRR